MIAVESGDDNNDPAAIEPQDRRKRAGFQRRKADVLDLVQALHALAWPTDHIAAAMGITVRRVQQVLQLLRLNAQQHDSIGAALTWLAKERPDLDGRLRAFRYFAKRKDGPTEIVKAA